jgi:DNA alkylation repair enzyme
MKAQSPSSWTPKKHSKTRRTAKPAAKWTNLAALRELRKLANPKARASLAYFGVDVPKAYGISAPVLHAFARRIGKDQQLAEELWASGVHEAKILAALIGQPHKITSAQMERLPLSLCLRPTRLEQSSGVEQPSRRISKARRIFPDGVSQL